MRGMVRAAADPAAKVHDLAQPQLPGGDGSSSRRRVALGATELGDRQQQARRLMQTATPTVVVQNCPNCTEAADTVCRCLTGNDSRVLISSKPVYPLRWDKEHGSCRLRSLRCSVAAAVVVPGGERAGSC